MSYIALLPSTYFFKAVYVYIVYLFELYMLYLSTNAIYVYKMWHIMKLGEMHNGDMNSLEIGL